MTPRRRVHLTKGLELQIKSYSVGKRPRIQTLKCLNETGDYPLHNTIDILIIENLDDKHFFTIVRYSRYVLSGCKDFLRSIKRDFFGKTNNSVNNISSKIPVCVS